MTKWIGRPILLSLVLATSILSTTAIASAAPLATSTVVTQTSPAGTPVVGQSVTYKVTVSINPSGPGQSPTGTVTFTDLANSTPGCGTVTLVPTTPTATAGTATATCTTAYTKPESGNILAAYSGDSNYASSNNGTGFAQTVTQAPTSTVVTDNATGGTVVTGQTVTFTATVTPVSGNAVTPTGTVTFSTVGSPGTCSGSATLAPGTGGNAKATCTIQFGLTGPTSVVPTTVTASYAGDTNFTGSSDAVGATVTTVNPDSTRVIILSSANPAVSGQALTFTAQVAPVAPGGGAPPGTVTFSSSFAAADGGAAFTCTNGGTAQVETNGVATCSVRAGYFTAVQGVSITAAYVPAAGPPSYTGSTATYTQAETQDSTFITIIVNPKHPHVNNPLSLTAIILNPPPGSGPITGLVDFVVVGKHTGPLNCTNLTNNSVTMTSTSGNEVTCNMSNTLAASNPLKVSVSYFGDSNYLSSQANKKVVLRS